MNDDQTISLIWSLGALVLVGSALMTRRIAAARVFRYVVLWIAIFALALLLVSFRDRIRLPWQHDASPPAAPAQNGRDQMVRITPPPSPLSPQLKLT